MQKKGKNETSKVQKPEKSETRVLKLSSLLEVQFEFIHEILGVVYYP
jgi:hypothetical protein